MNLIDTHGFTLSGATPAAHAAYERALAAYRSWHTGADAHVELALREAPAFVMAHVLQAWLLACSRDLHRVQSARAVVARAAPLPANERERAHLAALAAVLDDDLERALAWLAELLRSHPRDLLALQVAHVFDYYLGDTARLADRAASVLPAWSRALPGYHAVLSMHAFGLVENGEYGRGEDAARAALELHPLDARAHHAMAHVFEMSERPDDGVPWLTQHTPDWSVNTVVATHCWWHLALFHVARARHDEALAVYDDHVRGSRSGAVADLIDAAALLWRIELARGQAGTRWKELAAAWEPHVNDAYCSFTDIHAMLAFVGARDWRSARRLERNLVAAQARPTRHGATTRLLGLPTCRALMAYGRGDDPLAIRLLASVPTRAHRLGGSHAQSDVLHLTLQQAVERMRRRAVHARSSPRSGRFCRSAAGKIGHRSSQASASDPRLTRHRHGARQRSHRVTAATSMPAHEPASAQHLPRSGTCSASGEPDLVQPEGLVARAGHGTKRHVQTIPRVDGRHAEDERGELLVAELLAQLGIERVAKTGRLHLRQRFRQSQRGTFLKREQGRFAPDRHVMQAQLALSVQLGLLDVHVEAEGAAIELRRPDVDQVGQRPVDTAASRDRHAELLELLDQIGRVRRVVEAGRMLDRTHDRALSGGG